MGASASVSPSASVGSLSGATERDGFITITSSEQARDAGTRAEAAHRAELEEIDAIPELPTYAERADVVELLARADALDARDAADEDAADAPTVAPPSLALSRALSLRSSPSNDADVDAERPS